MGRYHTHIFKQPKQQSYYHEHFLVLDLEYSLVRLMQFPQTNCINLSISDQRLSMNVKNCIESSQLWDWLKSDQTICLFNNIFNNINVDENVDDLQYGIKELLCRFCDYDISNEFNLSNFLSIEELVKFSPKIDPASSFKYFDYNINSPNMLFFQ